MEDNLCATYRQCCVCKGKSHGSFFGVLACRGCSAFFRRSVLEKRKYKCKRNEDCDIQKPNLRNLCRACRLQTCYKSGISSNLRLVVDLNMKIPILTKYVLGMRDFNDRQLYLFSIQNPYNQYKRMDNRPELLRMERGSMSLFYDTFSTYFPFFDTSLSTKKIDILGQIWPQFCLLHRLFLSAKNSFRKNTTLMLYNGYYVETEDIPNENTIFTLIDFFNFSKNLVTDLLFVVKKFQEMHINEIEWVALVALKIYSTVEKNFGSLGFEEGICRVNELYSFMQDIAMLERKFHEAVEVAEILRQGVWQNGNLQHQFKSIAKCSY
uniref:Nuclear receptor domain-containing protein n=1 Tax=Ditylenchus dipsaci TaxID=166011 RepID=A0A915DWZ2_9BILA